MSHLSVLVALIVSALGLCAQPHPIADLLAELIRVNTSNPHGRIPGRQTQAARL
jgi:hypothetical protein